MKITGTKFVPICEGIEGQIRSLGVDENFKYESVMLTIDTLVVKLTKDVEEDVECFPS